MADDEETPTPPEPETEEIEEEVPEPPPHGRVPPESPPEGPPSEEPAEPGSGLTLADLSVYDTLRFIVGLLAQQTWMRLGLQVAPGRAEPQVELPQARVAIDALEAMVSQLEADSDAAEKRELETLLDNLRINYVKKAT